MWSALIALVIFGPMTAWGWTSLAAIVIPSAIATYVGFAYSDRQTPPRSASTGSDLAGRQAAPHVDGDPAT